MIKNLSYNKHFTASALILHDNKVLLVYHKKLDVWLYPGGHIESYENPDEALIREVKEETGLDVDITSGRNELLSNNKNDVSSLHIPFAVLCENVGDHYHNDLVYQCKVRDTEKIYLKLNSNESDEIGFFNIEEIKKLKLFDNFRVLLNFVLENEKEIESEIEKMESDL